MKFKAIKAAAAFAASLTLFLGAAVPAKAVDYPVGGPWGDINGWYSWYIRSDGTTIFCQNNEQWRYDSYGKRIYVDANGNDIGSSGSSSTTSARASTIAGMGLTYYTTSNGVEVYSSSDGTLYTVDDAGHMYYYGKKTNTLPSSKNNMPEPANKTYTMKYSVTTWQGTHIYVDEHNNAWWFSNGGYPNPYYGDWQGTCWKEGIPDYTYTYAGISDDNLYLWKDVYGHYWWFEAGGQPHQYTGKVSPAGGGSSSGGTTGPISGNTAKPAETNVDWYHSNTLEADGRKTVVYKGQYWQAPTSVSWAPAGMHLIGWDYAENTGYVRWAPGAWILNTGSDVYLYPVYSN